MKSRIQARLWRNAATRLPTRLERITASGRNGVLQIVIPKKPETTPRKIQVGTVHDA